MCATSFITSKECTLFYKYGDEAPSVSYANVDFAGDKDTRRSILEILYKLGDSPLD